MAPIPVLTTGRAAVRSSNHVEARFATCGDLTLQSFIESTGRKDQDLHCSITLDHALNSRMACLQSGVQTIAPSRHRLCITNGSPRPHEQAWANVARCPLESPYVAAAERNCLPRWGSQRPSPLAGDR